MNAPKLEIKVGWTTHDLWCQVFEWRTSRSYRKGLETLA